MSFKERGDKATQELGKKINEYMRVYNALVENKMALKIREETLDLRDDSILPEAKVLLEKFKVKIILNSRKFQLS